MIRVVTNIPKIIIITRVYCKYSLVVDLGALAFFICLALRLTTCLSCAIE